jgi:peptide/nickel transport system substrate-binding protein
MLRRCELFWRRSGPQQALYRIAGRQMEQDEGERHHARNDGNRATQTEDNASGHGKNVDLSVPRRLTLLLAWLLAACSGPATSRGDTIVFASGADLQSINPLLTTHPLAHQVQRYVLLTTLVRYDSALQVTPYLARRWDWSHDSLALTLHLSQELRWHDGVPTTTRDVVWTLDAARDPATGYSRQDDLADLEDVTANDDSTLTLTFRRKQAGIPDIFTDLAILPAHLLDSVPHARLRAAAWNQAPVGNGPFTFVSHTPNRRWVFAANPGFPASLGGPPHFGRLVVAVVDEPTTKLAALTSGELDFAGIQPAHAHFVERDPHLAVLQYPLLFTYAIVFNTRRAPFNDMRVRRAVALAVDRRAIVDGYLFGFGIPASGPIPSSAADSAAQHADIAAALALTGHRPIRFELLTVGSGEAALEQMVQSQLAAIGMQVSIRQLELSTYLDRVEGPSHDFDAAVMGIPGDLGLGQLAPLLRTTGVNAIGDHATLLRRFSDSVPGAFLYHARGVQGMNQRIRGVQMDLRGELPTVHDWYVKP